MTIHTPINILEVGRTSAYLCDSAGCNKPSQTEFRLEHPGNHRNWAFSCGLLRHDVVAFEYAQERAQIWMLTSLCRTLFPNGPVERIESLDDAITRVTKTTVHYAMACGQAYCNSTTGLTTDDLSFTRELVNNEHYYLCPDCSTLLAYALLRE